MEPKKANDPDQLGGWRINGRLGEGGFGTVFLAEKGAQKAAIKVIRQEFVEEEDARNRLATEADVLSKLSDPSIGKILDSDLTGEFPWIATEFINGPTLDDKVKYEGPLEEIAWFNLAANIFHAIVSANELGIIHKDIKPSNIILGETGNKLIDFGIAHVSGQTRTAAFGDREGSTPFSSPEHFTIRPNPKMDVFSAAATLAYAGKGTGIWTGDNDLQLMRSINEDSPNLEGLSKNQIKFILPLLEKNPSDRPSAQEAHESALGFIEFLLGKTSKPRPLKSPNRFKRLLNSRRRALAISLLLVASVGITTILNNSLNGDSPQANSPISQGDSATVAADVVDAQSPSAAPTVKASSSRECQDEYDKDGSNIQQACLQSAKAGDLTSIFYIGKDFFDKKNFKQAEFWFLKGAKRSDLNSTRYLIDTYTQVSNTTERDRWTKICADTSYGATDTSPLKDIAYCKMLQGFILTKSGVTKEAIMYLTDSADYGNAEAAAWLGMHYRDLEDKANALKWLTKAAELGSPSGINALILFADDIGDKALSKKWLTVSANGGNQVNMGYLALIYYYDKDLESARKWATKGVSYGDVLSTYVLGAVKYDSGEKVDGKALILKAANKNNLSAIRRIGSIYRLDEKNLPEATKWYEKLAARNDFSGTVIYSALLFMTGKDQESCTYNDKVLELGNQAKQNGTYDAELMDKDMATAKSTADNYCSKMYKSN